MPLIQDDLISAIMPVIKEAGNIVCCYFRQAIEFKIKPDDSLITQADIASEKYILAELAKIKPEACFIAEESGTSGCQEADYAWVVDPLDGTTNFAHRFPYFCISIALTYKNEPILGVIYDPLRDELFCAQQGKGAYVNGTRLHVSTLDTIEELVVSVGIPCVRGADHFWQLFKPVQNNIRSFRRLGSAALDMAYVAAGRLNGSFFCGLKWWDIAAGMVLIAEAGGMAVTFDGRSLDPDFETCLVSNKAVNEKLRNLLALS